MRRAQGYAVIVEPGKATVERDTFTCAHCNCVVFVEPMQAASDMGGWCMMCAKNTCTSCAGQLGCSPFERKIEALERRDRLRMAAAS